MRFKTALYAALALWGHVVCTGAFAQTPGNPVSQEQPAQQEQPSLGDRVFAYTFDLAQAANDFQQDDQNELQQGQPQSQESHQSDAALRQELIGDDGAQAEQNAVLWDFVYRNQTPLGGAENNARWEKVLTRDGSAWHGNSFVFSGMALVAADQALKSHLHLPKDQGLVVTFVQPHSTAAAIGIRQNDVLLKLGSTPLSKPEDFEKSLKAAGDSPVELSLLRGGKSHTIKVQSQVQVTLGALRLQTPAHEFWIGVSISPLEPALRAQLQLPKSGGLLVTEVFKDSPAEKAGLKVNDILLEFAGKPLTDQSKLVEAVQANGEKPVTLSWMREGDRRSVETLTPQRRQVTRNLRVARLPENYYFHVLRPGIVQDWLAQPEDQARDSLLSGADKLHLDANAQRDIAKRKQDLESARALTKRIAELEAEMGKLRKALDEFARTTTAVEELKKAAEELRKAAAGK
jgi:membrane-associated protease RseP (regulator of RpoE activity)